MQTAPRQVIFILFLVSVSAALWWTWNGFLLPPRTSIVGMAHVADTFRQCTRGAIEADSVFWHLKAEHVRRVEAGLSAVLARQGTPKLDTLPKGTFFHHQYLGYKLRGSPMILVVVAAYRDESASRPGAKRSEFFRQRNSPTPAMPNARFGQWSMRLTPKSSTASVSTPSEAPCRPRQLPPIARLCLVLPQYSTV